MAGFASPAHPAFYYQHGRFCNTNPSCSGECYQHCFDEFASFRKPLLLCKVTYTEGKKKCQFLNKRNYLLQES